MLVTTKKQITTEETVEVKLPFFSVEDNGIWKNYYAIHENMSIDLMYSGHICRLAIVNDNTRITEAVKHTEITEQDFDFAYQMALDRLTKAVNPQKESI